MKTASAGLLTALKTNVTNTATARLMAEWNQNRFAGPVAVVNTGFSTAGSDEFPLESIVSPNRPDMQGVLKARTTNRVSYYQSGRVAEGYVQSNYDNDRTVAGTRAYTTSANSKYKYFSSETQSALVLTGSLYALSSGSFELTYTKDIWMNKLVATFEAQISQPKDITIFYKTTAAGAWTQWTGTFQVDANGKLTLFRQANGTMSTTEYLLNPLKIRGIKVVVAGMSLAGVPLNVIEISARLQSDLSTFIIDYDVTNTMSEPSMVTPLGTCSANTASVTLSNTDGRFDTDRTTMIGGGENILYGIIDKNIRMWLDLGVTVSGSPEYIRQFTMWSDEWDSQVEDTVTVSLRDSSKIAQEIKPNAMLYQKLTTAGIAWMLCDSIGMTNYSISTDAKNDNHVLDYYWTDPERTVWEHFEQLSQATQTAIFFNEYDVLQILPRTAAYNTTKPVSWTMDTGPAGAAPAGRLADANKIADAIDVQIGLNYEANRVNVKYTPTSVSTPVSGIIPMKVVYEPEGTMALRASRLVQTMGSGDASFRITPADAKVWPYTGVIQVEGEFIRYTYKGYYYYDVDNVLKHTYIKAETDRVNLDKKNPARAYMNHFSGFMYCSGTRGLWGSSAKAHAVDIANWNSARYRIGTGTLKTWAAGKVHNKNAGSLQISAPRTTLKTLWYVVTRGASVDSAPVFYGTRMKFPSGGFPYGAAGMVLSAGANDSGYYIELIRSKAMGVADRAVTNELNIYVRKSDGTFKRINKGTPFFVPDNTWFDLDAKLETVGGNVVVSVAVNGVQRMTTTFAPANQTGESIGGRYGVFVRGYSRAEFEYYYASTSTVNDTFDQEGWFDRVYGGYQSSQAMREWTYGMRWNTKFRVGKPPAKFYARYNSLMMDEFGPVVHEVREMDVKFEEGPVLHSKIYISNDSQVICPEYIGQPFGASFVLANTARRNVIVNGEDSVTFGAENSVDQKLLIYGRTVNRDEQQTVTVSNDAAINRRGVVEVDIDSEWIQNKTAATEIANWITKHWGGGTDEVTVTTIGNPLLELGDIVAVEAPEKAMAFATHQYFVVSIRHSFDGGLESTFTLRRVHY
jgi:hypothetical protein